MTTVQALGVEINTYIYIYIYIYIDRERERRPCCQSSRLSLCVSVAVKTENLCVYMLTLYIICIYYLKYVLIWRILKKIQGIMFSSLHV